jgi:hypothetical protein
MKLFTIFLVITFFAIDGIQNAPVIHPIHVQTVPLNSITARPTSAKVTSRKPFVSHVTPIHPSEHPWWYWSTSTQHTNLISSSSPSSWWYNRDSAGQIFVRVFLYAFLITLIYKLLKYVCKSKKQQKPKKKTSPTVVHNKMYVSTIDCKREESPPSYVDIHIV